MNLALVNTSFAIFDRFSADHPAAHLMFLMLKIYPQIFRVQLQGAFRGFSLSGLEVVTGKFCFGSLPASFFGLSLSCTLPSAILVAI